jgi:hypothetical protein
MLADNSIYQRIRIRSIEKEDDLLSRAKLQEEEMREKEIVYIVLRLRCVDFCLAERRAQER